MGQWTDMFGPDAAAYEPPAAQNAPEIGNVLQPTPIAPPQNEAEYTARKQGWSSFLTNLGSDPDAMRSLMMFGTQMLQPRMPGQTLGGQIGDALQHGQMAYDFAQGNKREMARQDQQDQQKAAESAAGVAHTQAQTQGQIQENQVKAATADDVIAQSKMQRQKMASEVDKAALDLQTAKKLVSLGIPEKEAFAKIAQANGDAYMSTQRGRLFSNEADMAGQKSDIMDTMTPEEQKNMLLHPGGKQAGAQQQLGDYYTGIWTKANPRGATETQTAYDQRTANATMKFLTDSKAKDDASLAIQLAGPGASKEEVQSALATIQGIRHPEVSAASDTAAWTKARGSVKVGETYTGPDGKQYRRNK